MLFNESDINRTYGICEKDENNAKLRSVLFNVHGITIKDKHYQVKRNQKTRESQ